MALAPAAVAGDRGPPDLLPVPHPELAQLAEIGRQLAPGIARLEDALADPALPAGEVAEALGDLGRLYVAYELWEPGAACLENAVRLAPQELRWRYYLAYLEREVGRLERAAAHFETARQLRPDYAPAHLRLAEVYLQLGRVEDAADLAAAVLERAPGQAAPARVLLGRAALARRDYEAALRHLAPVLESHPEARWLHYLLATAYRGLGRLDDARRHLALQGPGGLPMSDPLIEELAELTTGASVKLRLAMAEAGAGRTEEALALYREAVASDPRRADVRTSFGAMLAQLGDLEGALEQYREALRISPEDPLVRYGLALALAQAGAYEESEGHLDEVLRLDPDFVDGLRKRAEVRAAQGRAEEGLIDTGRIVELEPWSPDARLVLARALVRNERLAEAADQLRAALRLDPASARAALDLGSVLARLDEPEAAAKWLRTALELEADDETRAGARFNLGLLDLGRDRPAVAAEHFGAAAELRPHWTEAHYRHAESLAQAGRPEAAAAAYGRVLALAPDHGAAHHGQAISLAAAGRLDEAVSRLEEGLAKFPQSGTFAHSLARLLATCPDPALRNGPRALELATAVVRAGRTLEHAETLAMALAEVGRFEEAARIQAELLATAEDQGLPTAALARMRAALERYRAGEPLRLASSG